MNGLLISMGIGKTFNFEEFQNFLDFRRFEILIFKTFWNVENYEKLLNHQMKTKVC